MSDPSDAPDEEQGADDPPGGELTGGDESPAEAGTGSDESSDEARTGSDESPDEARTGRDEPPDEARTGDEDASDEQGGGESPDEDRATGDDASGGEERVGRDRPAWTDHVVGDRMAVDQEFAPRVANSEFTSQEWGLIMTATEFRIRDPVDPESARIVADASKVEHVVPELEDIRRNMGAMGAAGGPQSRSRDRDDSGGIVGSIKSALGLGGSDGGDRNHQAVVDQAQALTAEYAELLQARLETQGKWDEIRAMAAEEDG